MKLEKIKAGSYRYKYFHIAYLNERKIWNIASAGWAGWNFCAEFKTLRECRKWLLEQTL